MTVTPQNVQPAHGERERLFVQELDRDDARINRDEREQEFFAGGEYAVAKAERQSDERGSRPQRIERAFEREEEFLHGLGIRPEHQADEQNGEKCGGQDAAGDQHWFQAFPGENARQYLRRRGHRERRQRDDQRRIRQGRRTPECGLEQREIADFRRGQSEHGVIDDGRKEDQPCGQERAGETPVRHRNIFLFLGIRRGFAADRVHTPTCFPEHHSEQDEPAEQDHLRARDHDDPRPKSQVKIPRERIRVLPDQEDRMDDQDQKQTFHVFAESGSGEPQQEWIDDID